MHTGRYPFVFKRTLKKNLHANRREKTSSRFDCKLDGGTLLLLFNLYRQDIKTSGVKQPCSISLAGHA